MIFLLKFNLGFVFAYLLYLVVFKNQTTLNAKRAYLVSILLYAAATPFLFALPINTGVSGYGELLNTFSITASAQTIDALPIALGWSPLLIIYLIGVVIASLLLVNKLVQLALLIRRSVIVKEQSFRLATHASIKTPASFFNVIFMPSHVNNNAHALILEHEKLHVREWHTLDVLLYEIVKVICWFNPFIYLALRELRFVHECIADKVAGEPHKVYYQELLVQFHLSPTINNLTNHFNNSSNLKRRIIMFNTSFSKNANIKKLVFVLPFFILFGILQSTAQSSSAPNSTEDLEKMPEFPGGQNALVAYLGDNIKYPEAEKTAGIEGTVYVEFFVAKNGKVQSAAIVKSAATGLDREALRVINTMPKWIPGEKNGKKVEVSVLLPIKFALN